MNLGGRTMKKIAFALLAALLVPGAAMAQTPVSVPALHDGVVVDPAGGTAYVMSPAGGIEARELATGNILWRSAEAAKPLLLVDGTLVAQAPPPPEGDLVVVNLDSRRGTAKERKNIKLPPGQRAQVTDGLSRSFRAQAFAATNGGVIVSWTSEDGRSHQGILPPEVETPQTDEAKAASARAETLAQQRRRGAVRLDLASGKVDSLPFAEAQAAAVKVTGLTASIGGGNKSGTPILGQLTSLDGRHTLTSERVSGQSWNRYRWTVTDAAGAALGTVNAPVSMAPFVVAGNRILYVAEPAVLKEGDKFVEKPLRLKALDLQTGAEQWEAPVVESTYRGPFPP